jgi:uncharacterized coiled-coil protein SlyX
MFGKSELKDRVDHLETALERLSELAAEQGKALERLSDDRAAHVRELTDIQEQAQRVLNRVHQRTKREREPEAPNGGPEQAPQVNPLALRLMGKA